MKLFSTLSALLLGCSSVLARPLEERQSGTVFLQPKTTIGTRYEIRQLRDQYPNQYSLFVVALSRWMKQPQSSSTSFFAIASIHGVPRENFNGVNSCGTCSADGYATHNSVLFPTWHRAYLGLFEQELTNVAKQVATEYPAAQRATMQKAANALRLPYYDSAARPKQGSPAFPNLMTDVQVRVNTPTGTKMVDNPLFRYNIADPSGFAYQYFTAWHKTFRYPKSNAPDTSSNTAASQAAMTNVRQSLADQFYGLFTNCHDWLHFSNDGAGSSNPGCALGVEAVHNSIHTAIGGANNEQTGLSGGHMYYLPISSFDPAFWLHHSNIDRIFAMWQTLNPNSFGATQTNPTSSWTIPQGQTVNAQSGLTPFRRPSGGTDGFWTSDGVRNWRSLGYTYPEYTNGHGTASDITRYINMLYGPNANTPPGGINKRDIFSDTIGSIGQTVEDTVGATLGGSTDNPVGGLVSGMVDGIGQIINGTLTGITNSDKPLADLPIPIGSPLVANNGSLFQYVANFFAPRYSLNGTYQVFLFNGEPSTDDLSQWILQDNLIGFYGVLSKPGMMDDDFVTSGSIPLTRTLQDLTKTSPPQLENLSEDAVVPWLTKNLVWKVAGPAGAMDPGSITGFVVSIYSSTAPQVADDQLPFWSPMIPLLDVTKNQSGGANSTEELQPPQQSVVPASTS